MKIYRLSLLLILVASSLASAQDCGTDYMLPGVRVPLAPQSFQVLAADGPHHLILDHLLGPAPQNYQYILRARMRDEAMEAYRKAVEGKKELLEITSTMAFCPADLNSQDLSKVFPLKFKMGEVEIGLQKEDVEVLVFRYLPSLLPQEAFRKALLERGREILPLINHAPLSATEDVSAASRRSSYITSDGILNNSPDACPGEQPRTMHTFLLLAELGSNSVLAVHYLDQAPQNFQTAVRLRLSKKEMRIYRGAKNDTSIPPVMQTRILPKRNFYFCMEELPRLVKAKRFDFRGQVFRGSTLDDYHLGKRVGVLDIMGSEIHILSHRPLSEWQSPIVVAKSVLGANLDRPAGFVDAAVAIPNLQVEMRYSTEWNFMGRPIKGYEANTCLLTNEAAAQLSKVQGYVESMGYSLLVFDCYRPQRAVDDIVGWTKNPGDTKMREIFYPDEPKENLIAAGYIDAKSGHSRGSTVDLTLVRKQERETAATTAAPAALRYREQKGDCRLPNGIEGTGQVNMGTLFDCFSEMSNTVHPQVPRDASVSRQVLKAAMEKFGFLNYPKEWWHFTLKSEPFKKQYFDFVVK